MKSSRFVFVVFTLFLLTSCSEVDPDAIPDRDIDSFTVERRGYNIPQGVVVSKAYEPFWIQHVATGYRHIQGTERPSKTGILEDMESCQFTKPTKDEIFASAFTKRGYQRALIHTISRENLAESTERFIKAYRAKGKDAASLAIGVRPNVQVVDVFVTETKKPVYLALIADSEVVWNILKAENVIISRVALIGKQPVGIAHLDQSVPIEILIGKKLERCKILPTREPQAHWGIVKNENDKDNGPGILKNVRERHLTFSKWFYDNFGVRTDVNMAEGNRVNHFLIGRLPQKLAARIPFKTLEGTDVRISKTDYLMVADRRAWRKRVSELVHDLARKQVGDDLTSLAPKSDKEQ
ncbi:MAG: hypothetical protein COB78_11820 [Hyphomicrobiales bacterium]|nr:MAG: hypothetical protein COB78_11820 [Hyphomicrobiales bacterium]